jgi:hypothetical protein
MATRSGTGGTALATTLPVSTRQQFQNQAYTFASGAGSYSISTTAKFKSQVFTFAGAGTFSVDTFKPLFPGTE